MKRLIRGRVNIGQPSYTPLAYVNQLDDITLELDIYNGNSPLDVTGQTVSLYAKRSNTTVVEQLSGLSTASTKVTGDVKNSCFAVPGITEMQLEFTDSTGKTTVSSFYINVNKSLSSEDSITAGNEIAILTEAK
ncbi:BppU family phage baseplate upper protein, partial [Bacteroides fragilis]|uniref:BppU family phage baseplate upper protein n=1 Tax=Bacteroides fragilis TaxID=817 RepID=UPI00321B410D